MCFAADLVIVALQLLMKTLVALLHLLLVSYECGEAVQWPRVQIISVIFHDPTQSLRLMDYLRPRLRHTLTLRPSHLLRPTPTGEQLTLLTVLM